MNVKTDTEYIAKTGHTIDPDGSIPLNLKSELTRCKDCKYVDEEEYADGNLHVCNCPDKDWATADTRNHSFVTLYKPEDYCSYGERKDND